MKTVYYDIDSTADMLMFEQDRPFFSDMEMDIVFDEKLDNYFEALALLIQQEIEVS